MSDWELYYPTVDDLRALTECLACGWVWADGGACYCVSGGPVRRCGGCGERMTVAEWPDRGLECKPCEVNR